MAYSPLAFGSSPRANKFASKKKAPMGSCVHHMLMGRTLLAGGAVASPR